MSEARHLDDLRGGRWHLWLVILTAVMIVGAVASAMIAHREGMRDTFVRETAQRILIDRAQCLQDVPMEHLPSCGIFGMDDLSPHLAWLLSPVGPVGFRLQVRQDIDGQRLFLRLVAHWGEGTGDVVVFRFRRPFVLEVVP